MVGIAGCFSLDRSDPVRAPQDVIDKIKLVQAISGVDFRTHVYRSDSLVAVNLLTPSNKTAEGQPATTPDGRYALCLQGEVFNLGDLIAKRGSDVCTSLLSLFLKEGPEFVSRLRGQFSILLYDSTASQLRIFNDAFGSVSMYYYQEGSLLLFGSEKKSVLALMRGLPQLDPIGLLQVFAHKHNLGSRTFIENLHSLPPNSVLEAGGNKVRLSSQRYIGFSSCDGLRESEAIERWCELLRKSVKQCTKGKERIALQLSGGLDSRAVACAIPRSQRPFIAITREAPNKLECQFAIDVAAKLKLDHHTLGTIYPSTDYIPAIVWRTECSIAYVHSASIADHGFFRQNADYLMGGQFGDISSGAHVKSYMLEPVDRKTFQRRVFDHYAVDRQSLETVFTTQFVGEYYQELKRQFDASFDRIKEPCNANAYQIWDQQERQANFILRAGLVNRHVLAPLYPFLDVDYYQFVLSLPSEWRRNQAMYRSIIYWLGPEVRAVPNANDGLRLRATPLRNNMEGKILAYRKRLTNRLRRKTKTAKQVATTASAIPVQLEGVIRDFLASDEFDGHIFSRPGIEELLDGKSGNAKRRAYLLRNLATFAVGIPMFVGRRVEQCPPLAQRYLAPATSSSGLP